MNVQEFWERVRKEDWLTEEKRNKIREGYRKTLNAPVPRES